MRSLLIAGVLTLALTPCAYADDSKDIVDTAVSAGSFKTLVAAVKAAGLVDTLKGKGPFTVFAPTDAAFAKLPKGTIPALLKDKKALASILTYHVVAGKVPASKVVGLNSAKTVNGKAVSIAVKDGKVFLNKTSQVVKTDIQCSNGIIHVIDTVILPPKDKKASDIVDTAVAAGSFKTLVTAVKAAGLVDTLKGKGPFTVFAPTDAAFAKLPKGTIPALLKDKKALANILTYHVVAGKVPASKVVGMSSATVVNGQTVTITVKDGKVFLNGNIQVIKTDIHCSNGVIHVIDAVLLPPKK